MEYWHNFLIYSLLIALIFTLLNTFFNRLNLPVYPFYLLFFLFLSASGFKPDFIFLKPNFDLVYNIFLPLILFESAININIHRFKIQFKTITFLTTIALLFNAVIFAFFLTLLFKIPFQFSLIFGTLISATDPIGVLAIFNRMKIPHRLKLLVEGESMLNDATTIIFFEIVLAYVIETSHFKNPAFLILNLISIKVVLSVLLGLILGYFLVLITRFLKKESILVNLLTLLLILSSYFLCERIFEISGPIFVIFAGLLYGNFSYVFLEEEDFKKNKHLFALLALFINLYFFSIVGFDVNLNSIFGDIFSFLKIILILIITRSVTVYLSFLITNKNRFFFDEPDVYPSWQHIINFGGLRGIIPLILVNQLPNQFAYKETFTIFTINSFIFTNLFYPFIVLALIRRYEKIFYSKLFLLKNRIIYLEELVKKHRYLLELKDYSKECLNLVNNDLLSIDKALIKIENELSTEDNKNLYQAFHLYGATVEKDHFFQAYQEKKIDYFTYLKFNSEIDLQIDALIYPEKFAGRVVDEKGTIKIESKSWRLFFLKLFDRNFLLFKKEENMIIENRKKELRERIISSLKVIEKLRFFKNYLRKEKFKKIFFQIEKDHYYWINYNFNKINQLRGIFFSNNGDLKKKT